MTPKPSPSAAAAELDLKLEVSPVFVDDPIDDLIDDLIDIDFVGEPSTALLTSLRLILADSVREVCPYSIGLRTMVAFSRTSLTILVAVPVVISGRLRNNSVGSVVVGAR